MTQVSDETLRTDHCGSLLWRYILTMAIMVILQLSNLKLKSDDNDKDLGPCAYMCAFIMIWLEGIAFGTWGAYELWGRPCSASLVQYTIYKTAMVMVVFQWFLVAVCTLSFIFMVGYTLCVEEKPTKKQNPQSQPIPGTNQLSYGV